MTLIQRQFQASLKEYDMQTEVDLFGTEGGCEPVRPTKCEKAAMELSHLAMLDACKVLEHAVCSKLQAEAAVAAINPFLEAMPEMSRVVSQVSTGLNMGPLTGIKVILIHHLTREVIGLIAALRCLGCRDIDVLFVVYGGGVAEHLLEPLHATPEDELTFAVVTPSLLTDMLDTQYRFSELSRARNREEISDLLSERPRCFGDTIQAMAVVQFVRQLHRAEAQQKQCLVIEDGGYLAPLLGQSYAQSMSVESFAAEVGWSCPDQRPIAEVVDSLLIGSVEHTRSGLNRLSAVAATWGRLAAPALSIAVSKFKINDEATDVAATVINAIENVLHAMGKVLSRRHCLVVGSRGNIGGRVMVALRSRLLDPTAQLCGIDLKVEDDKMGFSVEASDLARLPDTHQNFDLVIGVSGRNGFAVNDIEAWFCRPYGGDLILASGSSKTDEFADVTDWVNSISRSSRNEICGVSVDISTGEVLDRRSAMVLSRVVRFRFVREGVQIQKQLFLIGDLMPVNFLYHGVPTEVIDHVLTQLLSSALFIVDKYQELEPRPYAVDVDMELHQ